MIGLGPCLFCGVTNPDAFRSAVPFNDWKRRDNPAWHSPLCDDCWWVVDQAYDPRDFDTRKRERFLSIVAVLRRVHLYIPDHAQRIAEYFEQEEVAWLEPRE